MTDRKDKKQIHIRCEPAFASELAEAANKAPFHGNEAQFSRDAIGTVLRLRRVYGPRYELVIDELLSGADKEPVAA